MEETIYEIELVGEWNKFHWESNYLLQEKEFEIFILHWAINTYGGARILQSLYNMWKYYIWVNNKNDLDRMKNHLDKYQWKGDKK